MESICFFVRKEDRTHRVVAVFFVPSDECDKQCRRCLYCPAISAALSLFSSSPARPRARPRRLPRFSLPVAPPGQTKPNPDEPNEQSSILAQYILLLLTDYAFTGEFNAEDENFALDVERQGIKDENKISLYAVSKAMGYIPRHKLGHAFFRCARGGGERGAVVGISFFWGVGRGCYWHYGLEGGKEGLVFFRCPHVGRPGRSALPFRRLLSSWEGGEGGRCWCFG